MTQTIFLDLWNTLLANPQIHPIEKILKITQLPLEHHELLQKCNNSGLFTKTVDSEKIWKAILKPYKKEELAKQVNDIWLSTSKKAAFFPKTSQFLTTLKEKYTIGLATEINKDSFELLDSQYNLSDLFDIVIPTYKLKTLKSQEYYEKICEKFEINPKDVIMIGDNIYSDIIPANKAGLKTIILNRFELTENETKEIPHNTPICHDYNQVLHILQLSEVSL